MDLYMCRTVERKVLTIWELYVHKGSVISYKINFSLINVAFVYFLDDFDQNSLLLGDDQSPLSLQTFNHLPFKPKEQNPSK